MVQNTDEKRAYLVLLAGFVILIALLRSDLGTALFDPEKLFYRVPPSVPEPTLRVELLGPPHALVLRLHTENFRFANFCKAPEAGEPLLGHAHLYVDGRKEASLYEPMGLMPDLPPGLHRITVSLNVLPDHRAILVGEVPVSQELEIVVPPRPVSKAEMDGIPTQNHK